MLYFDFPKMKDLHKEIDKDDIFTDPDDPSFGLEKEPHCTLLYGFWKNVCPHDVRDTVNQFEIGKCTIHRISKFENERYDVLKFEVKNPVLHKINKELSEFNHTNKFKDYKPHLTVAYLKPGMAAKYIKKWKTKTFDLVPKKLVYSEATGQKKHFKIK
jgi:2'-5' RNA ligase